MSVSAAWGPILDIRFRDSLNFVGLLHKVTVKHVDFYHNKNLT